MTSTEYIGKGSYGIVTSTGDKTVTKTCTIFIYEQHNDFYLDDHSIKEAIFYQIVNKKRKQSSASFDISIPRVTVTIQHNHSLLFEMQHLGQPLSKIRHSYGSRPITNTIPIFKQILLGLYSIHKEGFTHGDLKPDNIVVDENDQVSIIDYGSICFWHHSIIQPQLYQRCTLYYVSPEELNGKGYSDKNDMWSFGVILFEWCTGLSFVLTLLKELHVPKKEQDIFLEYTLTGKENSQFNPTQYLSSIYESVSYSELFQIITKYIKDRDILKVIGHCLLKDVTIRCSAKRLLESNVFHTECPSVEIETLPSYTQINKLNDTLREEMQDNIWWICQNGYKFTTSIFGHSVTLFDRILLRANHQKIYIPPLILAIGCTVLSNMILKGHLLRASSMIELYNQLKKKNYDPEIDIEAIKFYISTIFSVSQFFLYNKSVDRLIVEQTLPLHYDLLREVCKQYILTTDTTEYVVEEYKKRL